MLKDICYFYFRIRLLILLFFFYSLPDSYSQNQHPRTCGFDMTHHSSSFSLSEEGRIKPTAEFRTLNANQQYTIPTVVHVVYHVGIENVSDTDVYKMLSIINQDFTRMNPDTINTPAAFAAIAGRAPFSFCLTNVDTNGNPSSGIDRVFTDTSRFVVAGNMISTASGGASAWNPNTFFNIWIGNANLFDLGPTYPGSIYSSGPLNIYLAEDYRYIINLSLGDTSRMYSGRSLTHDLGHCFGLSHPFNIIGCSDADSLSDTPLEASPAYGCSVFPIYDNCTTTFPGIMYMNFMDYSDENCVNMFTSQQVSKMLNNLQTFNPLLLSQGSCLLNSISSINKNLISVFPNPTHDKIKFKFDSDDNWKIKIMDFMGQIILEEPIKNDSELDLTNFSSGVYIILFANNKISLVKRIMKL